MSLTLVYEVVRSVQSLLRLLASELFLSSEPSTSVNIVLKMHFFFHSALLLSSVAIARPSPALQGRQAQVVDSTTCNGQQYDLPSAVCIGVMLTAALGISI